jgi:hypothetical protein
MIIELILTILAWRKGWGPAALLPLAIGLPIGVAFAAMSGSLTPALIADLLIYATLIGMIAVGRKMNPAPVNATPLIKPEQPVVPQRAA